LRKRVGGSAASALVKMLIFLVLLSLLPKLCESVAKAPQQLASAAGNAVGSATASLTCQLPLSNCKPPAAPPPQNKQCMTLDEAATVALSRARVGTICSAIYKDEREYSGFLYSVNTGGQTCVRFTLPRPSKETSGTTSWIPSEHSNEHVVEILANYHSHPAKSGPRFSAVDLCNYVANREIGYVVSTTPDSDGEVRKFNRDRTGTPLTAGAILKQCVVGSTSSWLDTALNGISSGLSVCTFLESRYDAFGTVAGTISSPFQVRIEQSGCPASAAPQYGPPAPPPPPTYGPPAPPVDGPQGDPLEIMYNNCTIRRG
jgi:hypothetical protein